MASLLKQGTTKQRQRKYRSKSEAATREDTIEITTKKTTMITGQGRKISIRTRKRNPTE